MPKPSQESKPKDGGFPEGGKEDANFPQGEKQKDPNCSPGDKDKDGKPNVPNFPPGEKGKEDNSRGKDMMGQNQAQAKSLEQQQAQGYQSSHSDSAFQSREESMSMSQSQSESYQSQQSKKQSGKLGEEIESKEGQSEEEQSEQGEPSDRELSEEEMSEGEFEESQSQSYESQSKEESYESRTETTTTSTTVTYITVFKESSTYVERLFRSDGSKKHKKEIHKFREECKIDDDDLGPEPARTWFDKSPELRLDDVESGSEGGEISESEEGSEAEDLDDEDQSLTGDVEYDPQDEEDCLIEGDLAPCPAKLWFEKLSGEQDGEMSEGEPDEAELSEAEDQEGSEPEDLQSGAEEELGDEIQYDEKDQKACVIKDDLAPCPAEYWFKRLRGMSGESDHEDSGGEEEVDGSEPEDLEEEGTEDEEEEVSFLVSTRSNITILSLTFFARRFMVMPLNLEKKYALSETWRLILYATSS